jgi:RIO kinase 1
LTKNSLTQQLAQDDTLDEDFLDLIAGSQRPRPSKDRRASDHKRQRPKTMSGASAPPPEPVLPGWHLPLDRGLDVTSSESDWLVQHLLRFHQAGVITRVLRRVKGGKEANVYCCAAHPATGLEFVAAKIYRPRLLRSLRNDSQYRQGRPVLDSRGGVVGARDWRLHKAIAQGTHTGREAAQISWIEYEYQTMQRLYQAGADVPRPVRHGEYAILMEYLGELSVSAPTLNLVHLDLDEAPSLFERLLRNVEIMLSQHVIHGDFSAYNVLYWEGQVKIIDFPQVVDPSQNQDAYALFQRDVERLCQYFARYGVSTQPGRLARDLWNRHIGRGPQPLAL